jgi:NAD(P)-dependent dehydrogenase (short-subunit alcohol dehydrogenase family)
VSPHLPSGTGGAPSNGCEPRRALVTGAGSGIGRATAVRLAAGGARVALVGRRRDPLEETAGLCREVGGEPLVCPADVTRVDAVDAVVGAAGARWGALDALVCSAGMAFYAGVEATSPEAWDEVLRVNLTAPFFVARAALPWLRRGDAASVVMVASTLGLTGLRGAAAYCAAKAGLVNFARALAIEEAAAGVRVNVVCPGVVDTPMLDTPREGSRSREERIERLAAAHPLGRIGRPEDIAAVIAGLLAKDAAFVTGAVVVADGGQSAGFLE